MIVLFNVEKKKNIIAADYCYEDRTDIGHVEYDINTGKIIKYKKNKEDEKHNSNMGSGKSRQAFELMVKHNKYPETYHYCWY
ncbi:MAG: hypothetical protein LUF92_16270 [Clostridiales bacterium]|nr:hypothetical protein [Clostridiales bacterium]